VRKLRNLALAGILLAAGGCSRAVSVSRLVPAPYNLGPARRLVLVEVKGSLIWRSDAQDAFLGRIRKDGVFTVEDATHEYTDLSSLGGGDAARRAKEFRAKWPADVYVGLEAASLDARDVHDRRKEKRDGKEVEVVWHASVGSCRLRVRLLDAKDGRTLGDFEVSRDERSRESEDRDSSLRDEAKKAALDAAVAEAVASFTPERVQDWIVLEEEAPLAKEGLDLIDRKDLAGARALWEKALPAHATDARLLYNLGAISESLGDRKAARAYYEQAIASAPGEARYRKALEDLDARRRDARALRTKP